MVRSNYPVRAAWAGLSFDELGARLGLPIDEWLEPGLGPSRGFSCKLSTGRIARIEWREYQPEYVEICLEYDSAFRTADLQAVADCIGVKLEALNKEEGQIDWT